MGKASRAKFFLGYRRKDRPRMGSRMHECGAVCVQLSNKELGDFAQASSSSDFSIFPVPTSPQDAPTHPPARGTPALQFALMLRQAQRGALALSQTGRGDSVKILDHLVSSFTMQGLIQSNLLFLSCDLDRRDLVNEPQHAVRSSECINR